MRARCLPNRSGGCDRRAATSLPRWPRSAPGRRTTRHRPTPTGRAAAPCARRSRRARARTPPPARPGTGRWQSRWPTAAMHRPTTCRAPDPARHPAPPPGPNAWLPPRPRRWPARTSRPGAAPPRWLRRAALPARTPPAAAHCAAASAGARGFRSRASMAADTWGGVGQTAKSLSLRPLGQRCLEPLGLQPAAAPAGSGGGVAVLGRHLAALAGLGDRCRPVSLTCPRDQPR